MTLAEVFALLAFIVSLLLTIVWTTPFLIFIIDVGTRIVKRGSHTIMAITTKRNDRPTLPTVAVILFDCMPVRS